MTSSDNTFTDFYAAVVHHLKFISLDYYAVAYASLIALGFSCYQILGFDAFIFNPTCSASRFSLETSHPYPIVGGFGSRRLKSSSSRPGRTHQSPSGAPSGPVTVEPPSAAIATSSVSYRRSRPGPVYGGLEGIFQPILPGKHAGKNSRSCPEDIHISSPFGDSCHYDDREASAIPPTVSRMCGIERVSAASVEHQPASIKDPVIRRVPAS